MLEKIAGFVHRLAIGRVKAITITTHAHYLADYIPSVGRVDRRSVEDLANKPSDDLHAAPSISDGQATCP